MPCSPREGTLLLLLPKVGIVVGVPTFTDPGVAGNHDRLFTILGVAIAEHKIGATTDTAEDFATAGFFIS